MLYKQLHIYRRPFATKGCQKPMSRHTKNSKKHPENCIIEMTSE